MMTDSPDGFLRSLMRAAQVATLWLVAAALSHTMVHTTTQTIPA